MAFCTWSDRRRQTRRLRLVGMLAILAKADKTMALRFQPVRLPREADNEALLVMDGDVLLAVVSRLSAIHGEAEGCWFPEMMARDIPLRALEPIARLEDIEAWI